MSISGSAVSSWGDWLKYPSLELSFLKQRVSSDPTNGFHNCNSSKHKGWNKVLFFTGFLEDETQKHGRVRESSIHSAGGVLCDNGDTQGVLAQGLAPGQHACKIQAGPTGGPQPASVYSRKQRCHGDPRVHRAQRRNWTCTGAVFHLGQLWAILDFELIESRIKENLVYNDSKLAE